jgi:hypothetical protein
MLPSDLLPSVQCQKAQNEREQISECGIAQQHGCTSLCRIPFLGFGCLSMLAPLLATKFSVRWLALSGSTGILMKQMAHAVSAGLDQSLFLIVSSDVLELR